MQDCPTGQMDKQTFITNFGEHFFPADGNTMKLAEYVFRRFDTNKVFLPQILSYLTIY